MHIVKLAVGMHRPRVDATKRKADSFRVARQLILEGILRTCVARFHLLVILLGCSRLISTLPSCPLLQVLLPFHDVEPLSPPDKLFAILHDRYPSIRMTVSRSALRR
jgi:hypothetical protein